MHLAVRKGMICVVADTYAKKLSDVLHIASYAGTNFFTHYTLHLDRDEVSERKRERYIGKRICLIAYIIPLTIWCI